jgi:hypothetical protein
MVAQATQSFIDWVVICTNILDLDKRQPKVPLPYVGFMTLIAPDLLIAWI